MGQGIAGVYSFLLCQHGVVFHQIDQGHMGGTVHKRKLFLLKNILNYCVEKIFRVIFRNSPMLFQKSLPLPGIPLIEQIKNGVDRTLG